MSYVRGNRVIQFVEQYCRLAHKTKGSVPFVLDPWEKRLIRNMYATRADGSLKHSRVVLSVGKKNGKTELAAALMLAHVAGPEAGYGERNVSGAGGSKEQAGIVFERCEAMIMRSPELASRIEVTPSTRKFHHVERLNYYEALPHNARSVQGELPPFWIFDELAQALSDDLYDALDRGQGTVEDDLGLVVSTMSHRPGNPMADLVEGIKRGQGAGGMKHWYAAIYQADPKENIYSLANVKKANPALGSHLRKSSVLKEIEEAKLMPGKRAAYKAYRLNLDVEAVDSLIELELWQDAVYEGDTSWEALKGQVCIGGVDLSSSRALTSVAWWFPELGLLKVESWLPQEILAEREADDRAPYQAWHADGHLNVTPGATIDYETVGAHLAQVAGICQVQEVRYDDWRMADLKRECEKAGITLPPMTNFRQGYKSMGPAVDRFERLLASGAMRHNDNPVTNMAARNTGGRSDAQSSSDARKPVPMRSGLRIDPIVAAIQAVAPGEPPEKPRRAEQMVAVGLYR